MKCLLITFLLLSLRRTSLFDVRHIFPVFFFHFCSSSIVQSSYFSTVFFYSLFSQYKRRMVLNLVPRIIIIFHIYLFISALLLKIPSLFFGYSSHVQKSMYNGTTSYECFQNGFQMVFCHFWSNQQITWKIAIIQAPLCKQDHFLHIYFFFIDIFLFVFYYI